MAEEASMLITVRRNAKKKSGIEVEQRADGHYYISKVPRGHRDVAVGDRVLSINGTNYLDFETEKKANDLIETFKLELAPAEDSDDDDDDDVSEEYDGQEVDSDDESDERPSNQLVKASKNGSKNGSSAAQRGGSANGSDDKKKKNKKAKNAIVPVPTPASDGGETPANWSDSEDGKDDLNAGWTGRPIQKYKPMDRFMLTVSKGDNPDDVGFDLVEYKGDFYVAGVYENGPFYSTAIDMGDKILSLNGKKSKDITNVAHAMEIIASKAKTTIFVMRPDPNKDKGYKWVMANYA